MPRIVPVLAAAVLVVPGALGATPIEQGHVVWIDAADGFATRGALVNVNGDAAADVVVGAGDRLTPYIWCAGRGNPGPMVNARKDEAIQPAPRVYALDGTSGEQLWERVWNTGGLLGQRPERETYEQLDGVHTGDLDADGDEDVLVFRTTVDFEGQRATQRAAMLDPADGATVWETERTVEGTADTPRAFLPMQVLGEPGGLLVTAEIHPGQPPVSTTSVLRFRPDAPPETLVELPSPPDAAVLPFAIPGEDLLRIVNLVVRITPPPNPGATIDLETVELSRDEEGDLILEEGWERPQLNAFPVIVTPGPDPLVVMGLGERAVALDADDGTHRWDGPDAASPVGGLMVPADVNGDGTDDVLLTTQFGAKPVEDPLLAGGVTAQIVAIDGRDGSELWRREELAGKFHATGMAVADVDADGARELVASFVHQDGFATCSYEPDEAGLLGVYDLATGAQRCRFSTDRLPSSILAADVHGEPGQEVIATTLGGRTYAFTDAEPGCGLLGTSP